jgi:hypothetical protein
VNNNLFYQQTFGNGDQVFARVNGTFKNGSFKGLIVRKGSGRKAEKVKKYSITKDWARLWSEADFIPQDVLKRYAKYGAKYIAV